MPARSSFKNIKKHRNMNKNIDLANILENCPEGTKFYSYIFGEETYFQGVSLRKGEPRPIFIYGKYGKGQSFCLSRKGHPYADNYGECCIFPSKEMRDWSKFTAPWLKKERFDPKTLTAFDKVLVFDSDRPWTPLMFSYLEYTLNYPRMQCFDFVARKVIPYNDETKHLVGTTDEAPEFYKYWED